MGTKNCWAYNQLFPDLQESCGSELLSDRWIHPLIMISLQRLPIWLMASLSKVSSSQEDDHSSHQFSEHLGPEISNIKSRSQSALTRKIKLEIKIIIALSIGLHFDLDPALPEQLFLCPDLMAGISW